MSSSQDVRVCDKRMKRGSFYIVEEEGTNKRNKYLKESIIIQFSLF